MVLRHTDINALFATLLSIDTSELLEWKWVLAFWDILGCLETPNPGTGQRSSSALLDLVYNIPTHR